MDSSHLNLRNSHKYQKFLHLHPVHLRAFHLATVWKNLMEMDPLIRMLTCFSHSRTEETNTWIQLKQTWTKNVELKFFKSLEANKQFCKAQMWSQHLKRFLHQRVLNNWLLCQMSMSTLIYCLLQRLHLGKTSPHPQLYLLAFRIFEIRCRAISHSCLNATPVWFLLEFVVNKNAVRKPGKNLTVQARSCPVHCHGWRQMDWKHQNRKCSNQTQ